MVHKGKSGVKPKVNPGHKAAVRAGAQAAATAAVVIGDDTFYSGLRQHITESAISVERKATAHAELVKACRRLAEGLDPLDGMHFSSACVPCNHKNKHVPHLFICLSRNDPKQPELSVREHTLRELRARYRLLRVRAQVRLQHSNSGLRLLHTSPRLRAAD